MKIHLAALAFSWVALTSSAAQPTDKSIRTPLGVMKVESLVNAMHAAMEPSMRPGIAQATDGKGPTAKQRAVMDRHARRMDGSHPNRTELGNDGADAAANSTREL